MIFAIQGTVCTGIISKIDSSDQTVKHSMGLIFGGLNILGMIIVLTCFEVNHRSLMAGEIEWQVKK
jgi:hypothetical protein